MGLGGRREKQVIAADPRNTAWLRDTNAPGYKLLTSMGWRPDASHSPSPSAPGTPNPNGNDSDGSSGATTPKIGLFAHNSTKRLRAIPIPKAGMEGIGYKPAGVSANVAIGALPSHISGSGNGMASAASSVFSRLGSKAALQFVSAGASKEVISRAKTEGGEFAGLLSRLNAAASNTPSAENSDNEEEKGDDVEDVENRPEGEGEGEREETKEERRERRKKRKLEKETRREAKRAKKASTSRNITAYTGASASASASEASRPSTPSVAQDEHVQTLSTTRQETGSPAPVAVGRFNPRMAARARHIASKRMLHASADALAEILGIAPTPSTSNATSPYTSGTSTPTSQPFISSTSLPATISSTTTTTTTTIATDDSASEIKENATSQANAGLDDKARKKAEKKAKKASLESDGVNVVADSTDSLKVSKSKKRKASSS